MDLEGAGTPRRAGADDARALADLWWRSRMDSIPSIPAPVHHELEVQEWFTTVVVPAGDTWMLDGEQGPRALLVLSPGWIEHLHVDPRHTGRGLGTALVDFAKQARPGTLDLWTFQSNLGARRFYERHGFVAVQQTDGDNEEGEPDVRYRWEP